MNHIAARVRSLFSFLLKSSLPMFALLFLTPAQAALITVEATGVIYELEVGLSDNGYFGVGDTFSVVYTYDDQTADQSSNTQYGNYQGAIQSWTIRIGTYEATVTNATTQNAGDIWLWNNNGSAYEWYRAKTSELAQVAESGAVNNHYFSNSDLILSSSLMDVFDSDALIGRTLNLDDFANLRLGATFIEQISELSTRRSSVYANITSLSITGIDDPTAVPLPAAAPLMVFGLGALGFVGTKRRRLKLAQ